MELFEIIAWILGLLAFFLITTYLIKRFAKAETYYVVTLLRTKKFLPLLDKYSRHKTLLNLFADIGLVLGFGAIAIDFLIGQKLGKKMRVLVFIASTIVLFEFFNVFCSVLLSNLFIAEYNFLLSLSFGIMGFSGFMIVMLAAYAQYVISSALIGEKTCPGVAPLLPGVSIPKFPVTIPLHGWISLLIILVVHEGMHGTLARKAKIKIKSAGLLLLGLLPIGAFVEPEEKELAASLEREQLRVYSAGPTANLASIPATLLVAFVLSFLIIGPVFGGWIKEERSNVVAGIEIASVDQNIDFCGRIFESPAFGKLETGMIVKAANGNQISSSSNWSAEMQKVDGKTYALTVALPDVNAPDKNIEITPNELGYHGYKVQEKKKTGADYSDNYKLFLEIINTIDSFLFWFMLLSLLMAIANFLPMVPFDGGKIAQIVLLPYIGFWKAPKEEKQKKITKFFFYLILALLLLNALPFFL